MVYEFDLLVRGLHSWLVIWYGLGVVLTSCWIFMEDIILHSLQLEIHIEGHHTGYNLHGFSMVLIIFLDVRFSLHSIWDWLDIVIIGLCSCMSCERWHGCSFISFFYWLWRTWESVGDFYDSFSCKLLVYVLQMSLRLYGFTSLRCCEWIGYRFDIIFCSGSFLVYMWQVFLLRLVIASCRLDMLII